MRQNDECHTPPLFCLVFIDRFSSLVILPGLNFDFFFKNPMNHHYMHTFCFEKQNDIFLSANNQWRQKQNFHRMNVIKASYKLGNFFGKSLKNRSFYFIQIFPFLFCFGQQKKTKTVRKWTRIVVVVVVDLLQSMFNLCVCVFFCCV